MKPKIENEVIRKTETREVTQNEVIDMLSYAPHFVNRGTWSVKVNQVLIDVGGQWQEPCPRETPFQGTYNIEFVTDYTGTDVANAVSDAKNGKFLQLFGYKKFILDENDI